jgi:preprotein translocase subunit YajC
MNKDLFYAIFWAVLAVASFPLVRFGVSMWMLFLIFSIVYFTAYRRQKKKESAEVVVEKIEKNITYGKIGTYILDGDEDESYGLYIEINHKPVFIDIHEDEFIGESEKWAATLFENTETINENFNRFVAENPVLQGAAIYCIGLYSKDPTCGEIIWDSDVLEVDKIFPAVALKGFDFVVLEETPWWKPVW